MIDVVSISNLSNSTYEDLTTFGFASLRRLCQLSLSENSTKLSPIPDSIGNEMDRVVIQLDDCHFVSSLRGPLLQMSAVFLAMLEGYFKESGKQGITLSEVSLGSLLILLNFLSCKPKIVKDIDSDIKCTDDHISNENTLADCTDMNTLLECLEIGSRFCIDSFVSTVQRRIAQHLEFSNLTIVLSVSSMHNCDWLAEQCLRFLLDVSVTKGVSISDRKKCWEEIIQLDDLKEITEKILYSIVENLNI